MRVKDFSKLIFTSFCFLQKKFPFEWVLEKKIVWIEMLCIKIILMSTLSGLLLPWFDNFNSTRIILAFKHMKWYYIKCFHFMSQQKKQHRQWYEMSKQGTEREKLRPWHITQNESDLYIIAQRAKSLLFIRESTPQCFAL